MKKYWLNLSIGLRIFLMLTIGIILLVIQFFFYHFLLMIGGMVFILISFFSIPQAHSKEYTTADKKTLFIIPAIIGFAGGIAGFYFTRNIMVAISSAMLAVGIYSFVMRRMLLSSNGYRVYEGIYAMMGSTVFIVLGGFVLMMILRVKDEKKFDRPSGQWVGHYAIDGALSPDSCLVFDDVNVSALPEGELAQGQYRVMIRSQVDCHSDDRVGVPLYDDIDAFAAEDGNLLVVWKAGAPSDTVLVVEREGGAIYIKQTDSRLQSAATTARSL